MHFENLKVRHRAPVVCIMSLGCGLDSDEGNGLSHIGIKVNGITEDQEWNRGNHPRIRRGNTERQFLRTGVRHVTRWHLAWSECNESRKMGTTGP